MQTPHLTLLPAQARHIESLLKGEAQLEPFYTAVADGYIEFPGALEYVLTQLKMGVIPEAWGTYLFVHQNDATLIGIGGYKGMPDAQGVVEIGYGIAPAYRGNGYATEAALALVKNAFDDSRVSKVIAHTLAEMNASTAVLTKCGMRQVAELNDPEDGRIWRWELLRAAS